MHRRAEDALHGPIRRLRSAVRVDETEGPIVNHPPATPPVVGPREDDGAARALAQCRLHLHADEGRLALFSVAEAVGAQLRDQQRPGAGDVMQPREIRAQLRFRMQEDVEGADVEKRRLEILGRRVVDVCQQRVGRRGPGLVVQITQEALDPLASVPANHRRRNFVPQREQHRRGMCGETAHVVADAPPNLTFVHPAIEKRHVLHPGHADDGAQAATRCLVEHRNRRRRVGAHGVGFELRDRVEVLRDARQCGKQDAVSIRRKRAVTDALDQISLFVDLQELAGYDRTIERRHAGHVHAGDVTKMKRCQLDNSELTRQAVAMQAGARKRRTSPRRAAGIFVAPASRMRSSRSRDHPWVR